LSRAKTDKADAKLIARYCLTMRPGPWTPPPKAVRELQTLLRRAEHLQIQFARGGHRVLVHRVAGPCRPSRNRVF